MRSDCRDVGVPIAIDLLAIRDHLGTPSADRVVVSAALEGRVSLAQRAMKSLPGKQELRFHVEHTPVEKAASALRSFLDQLVNPGLDDLHWQRDVECRQRVDIGTANARGQPAVEDFNPNGEVSA